MRIRALLLSALLLCTPAHAQTTDVWGNRGLVSMPDGRVGTDREIELGTRLIAIGGLPTAIAGYGRFSLMATDATLMYGIPGHAWPTLTLKHQLQRPTRENPTAVAVGLGMLGAPAVRGIPGSNLFVSMSRDVNTVQNGRDWTLFTAHLGFRADQSLQSRLMAGLELPLGQHGTATAEWIGSQGGESGYANFGLSLSPFPSFNVSLYSLGLPNASLFDRGLALGASYTGVLPAWTPPRQASAPTAKPSPVPPKAQPAPKPTPKAPDPAPVVKVPSAPAIPPAPVIPSKPPAPSVAVVPEAKPKAVPENGLTPPPAPGGTLIGRAVDVAGKAMPGVLVTLSGGGAPSREATTTPSGYFTFGGLPPGAYTLTVKDKAGRSIASQAVDIGSSPVELTLKPNASARLRGQIVDARTGTGLAGATVTIGKEQAQSDVDGYFRMEGLPAAPWTVGVKVPGYAPSETKTSQEQARIALKPLPGSVSGRVLNLSGKPVVGAIAQIGPLKSPSDRNGRYTLPNVPAGDHTLTLVRDGKTLLTASVRVAPGGKTVKDAKVREETPTGRFGMIGGHVRGASGEPLKGVKIVVEGKAVTVLTVSDEAGRFSVLDLVPGTYTLKLEKHSYVDQTVSAQVKAGLQASLDVVMKGR